MSKITIIVNTKTHERLKTHGGMGDSFDVVINRVLDKVEGKPNQPLK